MSSGFSETGLSSYDNHHWKVSTASYSVISNQYQKVIAWTTDSYSELYDNVLTPVVLVSMTEKTKETIFSYARNMRAVVRTV